MALIIREVVEHYERVAETMAGHFGGMPLVATYYSDGIDGAATYAGPINDQKPVPPSIATTTATTSTGAHHYVACAKNAIEWLAHRGAIELGSWAPTADADRCAYARVLVHPSGRAKRSDLHEALGLVRERVSRDGGDGIALIEARGGALWIPIAGAPAYDTVATWLRTVAADLLEAHPTFFSVAPLAERGDRFYLGTSSNHPGRFSALPYSATGEPGYTSLVPTAWEDLDAAIQNPIGVKAFGDWWETNGDLFGKLATACRPLHIPPAPTTPDVRLPTLLWPVDLAIGESRGPNIRAAITVLADGKSRTSDEIVAEAIGLGLLAQTTPARQLYTALIEYIARARGTGRVPQIVRSRPTLSPERAGRRLAAAYRVEAADNAASTGRCARRSASLDRKRNGRRRFRGRVLRRTRSASLHHETRRRTSGARCVCGRAARAARISHCRRV